MRELVFWGIPATDTMARRCPLPCRIFGRASSYIPARAWKSSLPRWIFPSSKTSMTYIGLPDGAATTEAFALSRHWLSAIPLLYVSGGQINAQIPFINGNGTHQLSVMHGQTPSQPQT